MALFRRRPVNVEAFQWTGEASQLPEPAWFVELVKSGDVEAYLINGNSTAMIKTSFGIAQAFPGDWIVKGAFGVFVSKDGTFQTLFEPLGAEVVVGGEPKDHP